MQHIYRNRCLSRVMLHTLRHAKERGATCHTLEAIVRAIWFHLTGENIELEAYGKQAA